MKKSLFIMPCLLLALGCQTIPAPYKEYSLARAAMEAARSVQAPRHSPGYWQKADEFYRQARILFREREFGEAQELFVKAIQAAEVAETQARVIRQKSGDIL